MRSRNFKKVAFEVVSGDMPYVAYVAAGTNTFWLVSEERHRPNRTSRLKTWVLLVHRNKRGMWSFKDGNRWSELPESGTLILEPAFQQWRLTGLLEKELLG